MSTTKRPNKSEKLFLNLAYNRFGDIYEELTTRGKFYSFSEQERYSKIKDIFSIYSECLKYEPINWYLDFLKKNRPLGDELLAKNYFRVIRHIIIHFPFHTTWDGVWFNRKLINWADPNSHIHNFFEKYDNAPEVKYRLWVPRDKKLYYISIRFPQSYMKGRKIFLKDLIEEFEGIRLCLVIMIKVLQSQIDKAPQT